MHKFEQCKFMNVQYRVSIEMKAEKVSSWVFLQG